MSTSVAQLRVDSKTVTVQRYDTVTLAGDTFSPTPQGGIRAKANCSRSGVFEYELPDGTKRLEWRPPEEVFAPESYQTLWDAPITIQHPRSGEVTSDTYTRETIGHVCSDVQPAGEFLTGHVVIQDEGTVRLARSGSLKEFSPGYLAALQLVEGIVPDGMPDAGKPYNAIQRRIRYNHLAFLPPGQGRQGSEVSIRLDSRGNQIGPLTQKDNPMTPEQAAALEALTALLPKLQALAASPAPAPAPAPAAPVVDTTPAPAPAAPEPKQDETAPVEEPEKKTDSKDKANKGPRPLTAQEHERIVNDSIELRDQARQVLGSDYNFRGKTNQQVMVDVVKHVDSKFELGNRSNDYLQGKFESALELLSERQHAQLRSPTLRTDSEDDDVADDAWIKKGIASK